MSLHLIPWPNGLGWDYGEAEIWIHKNSFRVFNPFKVLRVPFEVTKNPITAAVLCAERGLLREQLDDMPYHEAQSLYLQHLPTQQEMF